MAHAGGLMRWSKQRMLAGCCIFAAAASQIASAAARPRAAFVPSTTAFRLCNPNSFEYHHRYHPQRFPMLDLWRLSKRSNLLQMSTQSGGGAEREGSSLFQSINAVTLVTHDMEASCSFYSKLGLFVTYGGSDSQFTTFSANKPVRFDNNLLHVNLYLSQTYTPPENGKWNKRGRCIFFVEDVDALHLSLKEQGVAADEPKDAAWGERYFHVIDPSGHLLSFATPIYDHPRWHK